MAWASADDDLVPIPTVVHVLRCMAESEARRAARATELEVVKQRLPENVACYFSTQFYAPSQLINVRVLIFLTHRDAGGWPILCPSYSVPYHAEGAPR